MSSIAQRLRGRTVLISTLIMASAAPVSADDTPRPGQLALEYQALSKIIDDTENAHREEVSRMYVARSLLEVSESVCSGSGGLSASTKLFLSIREKLLLDENVWWWPEAEETIGARISARLDEVDFDSTCNDRAWRSRLEEQDRLATDLAGLLSSDLKTLTDYQIKLRRQLIDSATSFP